MKEVGFVILFAVSLLSCGNPSYREMSHSLPQGSYDSQILGNWCFCLEGFYYEVYYTDSFEIGKSWFRSNYFLPDDEIGQSVTRIRRYDLKDDSIFFFEYLTPISDGRIAFPNIDVIEIHETVIDSVLLSWSWVEKNKHYTLERLPDTIPLPPMDFDVDKHAWQDWWKEHSYSGFKIRAHQANCLSIFSEKEIDSIKTEFLNEWNDTSNLDIFDLEDSPN
jgi:hypothetical protein